MTGLDGVQILLILERQGFTIDRGQAPGDFSIRPLDRLTALQKAVLAWHLDVIVAAIRRSLAPFTCTFCDSLAWRAPEAPQSARYWLCGSCPGWGRMRQGKPITKEWKFCVPMH
jgi:hypothetical protein